MLWSSSKNKKKIHYPNHFITKKSRKKRDENVKHKNVNGRCLILIIQ